MLTFIQLLEALGDKQAVIIPGEEVERLAERFGSKVHGMGVWNKGTDGSVEIPISNITEAVKVLDRPALSEAIQQLKSPAQFTDVLSGSSAAMQLVEALYNLHLQQFQSKVERYQSSCDLAEAERLREEISRELFGA